MFDTTLSLNATSNALGNEEAATAAIVIADRVFGARVAVETLPLNKDVVPTLGVGLGRQSLEHLKTAIWQGGFTKNGAVDSHALDNVAFEKLQGNTILLYLKKTS